MDGFLNVLKPSGVTSHDVVLLVRDIVGTRAGHLGTLDPLAVGVLPVVLGAYRRLSEYCLDQDKRYLAEFVFGVETDSGDVEGQVVERKDARFLGAERVKERLAKFTGTISQEPPAFSALKVQGRKMYQWAREGVSVPRKPRTVQVHRFNLLRWTGGVLPKGLFSMEVSRGTYVRSLAIDLGRELGVGATVSYLLRSRSGPFGLDQCHTLGEIRRAAQAGHLERLLLDPLQALPGMARFHIVPSALDKVIHGVGLGYADFEDPVAVASHDPECGPFLAYEKDGEGMARIVAVVSSKGNKLNYHKVLIRESDRVCG
ncbi:MAG: tRNA pseudouridine(55) synthase TruB [Bacillota bacterium]|jgi:tRNA pseudouridine55 synthase